MIRKKHPKKVIVSWWSGGIASAVTCKLCLTLFPKNPVRIVFIDTHNEHDDTMRFKKDCEKWYGQEIETISAIPQKFKSIQDVWLTAGRLNVHTGAICSSELKRDVRENFQEANKHMFLHQAFGFDATEPKRALMLRKNNLHIGAIFPLLLYGYTKDDCVQMVEKAGITLPEPYLLGYKNNNCFKTGCVQGGIGYWQKIKRENPEKFEAMSKIEHTLSDRKKEPVTILKDRTGALLFLKKHPNFPNKDLSSKKQVEVLPLLECNGFCAPSVEKNPTEDEINFEESFDFGLFSL